MQTRTETGEYAEFAKYEIGIVRPLYTSDNDFTLFLDNVVSALDSATIHLGLSVFPWAKFRKHKGAVKIQTQLELRGNTPVYIDITDRKTHDVNFLDNIDFEPDVLSVMDKAYTDFARFTTLTVAFTLAQTFALIPWIRSKKSLGLAVLIL